VKETIAVTGATGHVGANLIRMLSGRGFHVRALVREPSETLKGFQPEQVYGDLSNLTALKELCRGSDVVIHTAALISIGDQPKKAVFETNVTGTHNLIWACKQMGVRRLIHFSSVDALVTDCRAVFVDESTELDVGSTLIYKRTKALGERLVMEAASPDFEVIVLSPAAIMGPFDFKPSLIGKMLIRMYNGQLPVLVPGGYHWVDVRDICDAAISAIHEGISGEKYLLAGHWADLVEIARMIQLLTKKKVVRSVVSFWMAYLGVPFIKVWSDFTGGHPLYTHDSLTILQKGYRNLSSTKAIETLGFTPRPLSETLTDTLAWFKQNGQLS